MTDDLPPPLFGYDLPPGAQTWTVGQAAALIAGPGVSADKAAAQLRHWLKLSVVHSRGKQGDGRTAAQLLALDDVAVAKVCGAIMDAGVADLDALRAASLALYNSPAGGTFAHSIAEAWAAIGRGEFRGLQIDFVRDVKSGRRIVTAQVTGDGLPKAAPPTTAVARAALLLPLPVLMLEIAQRLNRGLPN